MADALTTIGAYDAKARLSSLLDRVEHGEEIVITRHGNPIARLVPEPRGHDAARGLKALEELSRMRERLATGGVRVTQKDIRAMRDEGRR